MPAYPAVAILAGVMMDRLRVRFAEYFEKPVYLDAVIAAFLLATVLWSVPLGLENALNERFLIRRPWHDCMTFYGFINE